MTQDDRFRRITLMLGEDACEMLRRASVTIVGLGAVGSYALEALARSGVGNLRLVNFDKIAPSNINRQLLALGSTIGRQKCEVAAERVLDINPDCRVEAIAGFLDGENVMELIGESPNLVIDAIDALNPKVQLLATLRRREIPVITCLGAALRFRPIPRPHRHARISPRLPLGPLSQEPIEKTGRARGYPMRLLDRTRAQPPAHRPTHRDHRRRPRRKPRPPPQHPRQPPHNHGDIRTDSGEYGDQDADWQAGGVGS